MAVQFSAISNLWTDATWQTVDATSYLKSEVATTTTTTSFVASTAFTPGAITVEGILLRVKGTTTTPTGTFSVELFNSTGSLSVATVTCNTIDIVNNDSSSDGGWVYFKFGSPVVLLAATSYSVRIKSSVAGTVTIYRDGTAGNWSRGLVTSTTSSLSASDDIIICGNITSASTTAVNTITFDYTGANSYGSLEIGSYGKLICQNSASTNYKLTINSSGLIRVAQGGIFEIGNSSTRIDSTSTFLLTLTNATNGVTFIDVRNYGVFRLFGASKTRKALLAADAAISATTLTTDISTGWKSGDNIGIAGTSGATGVISVQQLRTLSVDASATSLTISAGLTFSTEGTSPVQADLINLTSNVVIQGSSVALCGYTTTQRLSIYDLDQVEYRYMGATTTLTAANIATNQSLSSISTYGALGTFSLKDCSFWNNSVSSFLNNGNNIGSQFTIDGCVFLSMKSNTNYSLPLSGSVNGTFASTVKNCVIIGYGNGIRIMNNNIITLDNNVITNCTSIGLVFVSGVSLYGCYISNMKIYRCIFGIFAGAQQATTYVTSNLIFSNITAFRNGSAIYLNVVANSTIKDSTFFGNNISPGGTAPNTGLLLGWVMNTKIINCSFQGGVGTVTPIGVRMTTQDNNFGITGRMGVVFERCNFGTITKHTSGDVMSDVSLTTCLFNNCNFGSTNLLTNANVFTSMSRVSFQRLNGNVGSNRSYTAGGYLINDTVIYSSAPSSLRMVPNIQYGTTNAGVNKLSSTIFPTSVASGSVVSVSIRVRKSITGDGTAYGGAQPRLILKSNPAAGSSYDLDIVCATASAAAGTWETLSYTLPAAVTDNVGMEFYIDCSGNNGWVNVDTFISNNSNSMTYYMNGEPITDPSIATEKSTTFLS